MGWEQGQGVWQGWLQEGIGWRWWPQLEGKELWGLEMVERKQEWIAGWWGWLVKQEETLEGFGWVVEWWKGLTEERIARRGGCQYGGWV